MKINEAYSYAYQKHAGQKREGTSIPYIVHPMDVASILLKEDQKLPEEIIIAGLLHDVLEDTKTPPEEIERRFGKKVVDLVKVASEPESMKNEPWTIRKSYTISKIKQAKRDAKLVSCADKLANFQEIVNDFHIIGDALWDRFNCTKEDIKWYYQNMVLSYREGESIEDTRMFRLLQDKVDRFYADKKK